MSNYNINTSNLLKSYSLNREDAHTRIIDNNSVVEEKLERIRFILPEIQPAKNIHSEDGFGEKTFTDGLDVTMLDALTESGYSDADNAGESVSNVIKAGANDAEQAETMEAPAIDEILSEARAEIDLMKQEALSEIEAQKNRGYEEGRQQGYAEGVSRAEAELNEKWAEIERARQAMAAEREAMIAELEPQFVHAITAIYEKIFEVDLRDNKTLVVNLLRNTLLQIPGCQNYLLHVSREDREYVMEHKGELVTLSMPEEATIDVVEDVTLKAGECMIETSNGIYDCGLGTELSALRKKLELLSFTP